MDSTTPTPRRPKRPDLSIRNAWLLVTFYLNETLIRYRKSPILIKVFVWIFIIVNTFVGSMFIFVGPKAIGQKAYDISQVVAAMPFGWLILVTIIAITSFPPLIGWSTTITLCGFAYGLKGWFVAAIGAVIGAAMSFVILRMVFRDRLRDWSEKNQKWVALENVIRARGLPLIILIRLSPFPPWVYANLLFASIETVSFGQFMIATFVYTARLFVAVWIGSRIAMFSDGNQRDKMDTKTKIVNGLSILIGVLIAFLAGWVTWRLTEKEIKKVATATAVDGEGATEALEEADDSPLIRSFSPQRYRDVSFDEPSNNDLERGKAPPVETAKPDRSGI